MKVLRPVCVGAFLLCVHQMISPAAAFEPALAGAWAQDRAECEALFSHSGKTISFKTPINAFDQAFIISGRQIRTPKASCRIRRVKKSGDRRILALTCATSVAVDEVPAILAPLPDGTLRRYVNDADKKGSKYERCRL
jgi:hypothetical protein